jgi:hypothetical protein
MVVFPIDKEPLVRGRVVSEWGFFLSSHSVPLAPISHPRPVRLLAIRARFGCWGLFIGLRPFPLVKTELKAEWKREQQKEIIVRFKRELKPDNSLVSIWKPFILPRQGGGINGISGCKLARTCSVRIADMIILVRLGFQQLC